jgi:histidyl-tRNA synthetase
MAIEGEPPAGEGIDVFFAFEDGGERAKVLPLLAQLRREGRACEMEYAGRSLKGQLTQAQRLGARVVVIAGADKLKIRRREQEDVEVATVEEVAELL